MLEFNTHFDETLIPLIIVHIIINQHNNILQSSTFLCFLYFLFHSSRFTLYFNIYKDIIYQFVWLLIYHNDGWFDDDLILCDVFIIYFNVIHIIQIHSIFKNVCNNYYNYSSSIFSWEFSKIRELLFRFSFLFTFLLSLINW